MAGWKKVDSKTAFECPHYSISEDDVIRPDGTPGKYFYVVTKGSVSVIAEDKDEKICMVSQHRYTADNELSVEVVAGGIEKNEEPLAAAKRELVEEAGITAKEWIYLGNFRPFNGISSEIDHVYLARDLTKGISNPDSTEDISLSKKSLAEIKELILNNEITDGQAIAALMKYIIYKENV